MLEISKTMVNGVEDGLIQMGPKLRNRFGVNINDFVKINQEVALQVNNSTESNDNNIYVTKNTFKKCKIFDITIVNSTTIGCDPELYIVNNTGQLIDASYIFPKWNAIGSDGMLCELRPSPHYNVNILVNNIKKMLQEVYTIVKKDNLSMLASSSLFKIPAGFHIHMGLKKLFLDTTINSYSEIIKTIVKIFDYYVGVMAIIPEGYNENYRRCFAGINYGKISDHRVDNRTFEYRVPGGILLKSKELTAGVLSIASIVIDDIVLKIEKYIGQTIDSTDLIKSLYPNVLSTNEINTIFKSKNSGMALSKIRDIYNDLSKMETFDKYSDNIIDYINYCNKNLKLQPQTMSINKNWKLL
jgi:hypothetical protein